MSTRVDAFGAYVIWKSVQLHFTTRYNIKNGIIKRFKRENFLKEDNYFYVSVFDKISKNCTTNEMLLGYIEICANTDKYSIHDFSDALVCIKKRLASNEALLHDIDNIKLYAERKNVSVYSLFRGNNPIIVRMYTKGYINIDTVAALDTIYKCLSSYKGFDPLLEELLYKVMKYKLLFNYNQISLKNILGIPLETPP